MFLEVVEMDGKGRDGMGRSETSRVPRPRETHTWVIDDGYVTPRMKPAQSKNKQEGKSKQPDARRILQRRPSKTSPRLHFGAFFPTQPCLTPLSHLSSITPHPPSETHAPEPSKAYSQPMSKRAALPAPSGAVSQCGTTTWNRQRACPRSRPFPSGACWRRRRRWWRRGTGGDDAAPRLRPWSSWWRGAGSGFAGRRSFRA